MPPAPLHPKAEPTRTAILQAAIEEFAQLGEAGARTEAIAKAAGVNKALVHYYFGTKELLHEAVLDAVFRGVVEHFRSVFERDCTPGERLLRYWLRHFDHLAEAGSYTRLMGQEMMRARTGQPTHVARIVKVAFGPLHASLLENLQAGMASGELRALEPGPTIVALTGANVFYFMSAPFFREIAGREPREPELLARQRIALLDLASTVLFADPARGRALAAGILANPDLATGDPT